LILVDIDLGPESGFELSRRLSQSRDKAVGSNPSRGTY
jgi:hypothetical protein